MATKNISNFIKNIKNIFYKAYFTATLVLLILISRIVDKVCSLFLGPSSKRTRAILNLAFRTLLSVNPQLIISSVGFHELDSSIFVPSNDTYNSGTTVILINHVSLFDGMLFTGLCSKGLIENVATLSTASVFGLPLFGPLMKACGHFPVYFSNKSSFKVDKEKQAVVKDAIKDYISKPDNILAFFPEGSINRNNPDKLNIFRAGSIELLKQTDFFEDTDPNLFLFIHTGIDDFWPHGDNFGGTPAEIFYKVVNVNSRKYPIVSEYHKMSSLDISTSLQDIMQKELDRMLELISKEPNAHQNTDSDLFSKI